MANEKARGKKRLNSANTQFNALSFMINQAISSRVNTAEIVKVVGVEAEGTDGPAGYVDVLPLVCFTDGWGETIPSTPIYHIPYARIQAGRVALVIDPVVGDIGIAVFAKRDSSGVKTGTSEPVQPGSFRSYDYADGFYIGGFINKKPNVWVELDNARGNININTSATVTVTANTIYNTARTVWLDCEKTIITGDLEVLGDIRIEDMDAGTEISLKGHIHSGVESGPDNTGKPVT